MGNINRSNPTVVGSGTVIADYVDISSQSKGNLIGSSSYAFGGNPTGLALSQNVAGGGQILFNSPSLLNMGSVFPGQAVTLTITATAGTATTLTIKGYNGNNIVTETLAVSVGTSTLTSVNSYTLVNSIVPVAALTNVSVGVNPLITTTTLGVKQPQLAASLDINSSKGAILYPKATKSQIEQFDSTINGVTYASTDGMRVYNTTTNSFCEKVRGSWSGLYLEEFFKPTRKKVTFALGPNTPVPLSSITPTTSYQILPTLNNAAANTTYLSPAKNKSLGYVTLSNNLLFPTQVTATISATTGAGGFQAIVTGYYNGILFSETIGKTTTTNAGTISTLARFSSITSIQVISVGTNAFTVSFGYALQNIGYVIYNVASQWYSDGVIAGGASGVLQISLGTTSPINIQLVAHGNIGGVATEENIYIPAFTSIARKTSMTLNYTGGTFNVGASQSSIFVTVEYDIVW